MKALLLIYSILMALALRDLAFAGNPTAAGARRLWVEVRPQKSLYVEYYAPKLGQPTLVILNGLTYSTRQWDPYVSALVKVGVGVVAYDMDGQGQTLLRYAPATHAFPIATQVRDLKVVLEKLQVPAPYNLVGLSYGGGVGIGFALENPQLVKNLILMAPYTKPLEKMDVWIKAQIWATRATFPLNPASDDELYDFFYHQIVYATYPQSEPIVLENPFKLEAVFRLGQGIRKFVPEDFASDLRVPTHLMVARRDQYIPATVLESFWSAVPKNLKKSRIFVADSEHKLPEAVPNFAAAWTYYIVKGHSSLFLGKDFEGQPRKGTAQSGKEIIRLTSGE